MFAVKISGKQLVFRFMHSPGLARVLVNGKLAHRRITTCSVHSGLDREPFEKGFAFCHPTDQFSRRIGRKIALRSLLRKLFPDRSVYLFHRQIVWNAYFALRLRGEWAG